MMPNYAMTAPLLLLSVLQISQGLQQKMPFNAPLPGCPMYQVGQSQYALQVQLKNQLTLKVMPSHPLMVLQMIAAEQERYQAVIDGAAIKLYQCYNQSQCTEMREETAKISGNLLDAGRWNDVIVNAVNDQIAVSVGNKLTVTSQGLVDETPNFNPHQSDVQVTILGESDVSTSSSITLPNAYHVNVNVQCNDTNMPNVQSVSPVEDQNVNPIDPAPYKQCSLYEVRQGSPEQYIILDNELTMALFPNKPVICLHFRLHNHLYKAVIDGTMLDLSHCRVDNTGCEILSRGGVKDSDVINASTWNYVTIAFINNMIRISVNMKANVTGTAMSVRPGVEHIEVVVVATDGVTPSSQPSDYVVAVNIACNSTFNPIPVFRAETTPYPTYAPVSSAPVVGNEISTSGSGSSGRNTVLWVLLGIFIAVLCVAVVALLVSSYLKKRSATINQHTPLQEQHQH